jgi:hypothetical protein
MKNFLLLLAASGILFAGCKDDTAFGAKPVGNRRDVLTSRTWRLVQVKESGQDVPLSNCQLDNIYVFDRETSTGYMDEGATKCDDPVTPTEPGDTTVIESKSTLVPTDADGYEYDASGRRINFTWEVPGDQRELIIYDFGGSDNDYAMEIDEFSETRFIVRGNKMRNGKVVMFFKTFEAVQ